MRARKNKRRPTRSGAKPSWRAKDHILYFRRLVVKAFQEPADNQEWILAAFQEQHWVREIDDPLPHKVGINPKTRLHNTRKQLNRNQKNRLIRFRCRGRGTRIRWEPIEV